MDREADSILTLPEAPATGTGGEYHLSRADAQRMPGLACTVESPDLVATEASRDRLELTAEAGCLALAADTAQEIRARDGLERMLAHQLAAAHTLAMRLAGRAATHTANAAHDAFGPSRRQYHAVEAARAANAAARMMDAFQRGALALQRLRMGGQQVVTVQHVTVGDGGRAMVAGSLRAGGKRRGHSPE